MKEGTALSEGEDCSDRRRSEEGGVAVCSEPRPGERETLAELAAKPQWHDWRWQLHNRITSIDQLRQVFPGLRVDRGMAAAAEKFPLAITPYYASLIKEFGGGDPALQMCVPQGRECFTPAHLRADPLEEDKDMPVAGLVHRYADRALVLATSACASYCRYCTRKRVAGQRETTVTAEHLEQMRAYLSAHPEVRDVIVSGGDPLTMPTEALEHVLATIRSVPTVEVLRIGTRCPAVLPMRVTDELVTMLRGYHPLYVNTHFNHPVEVTAQAAEACTRLADAGIPVGNQTVLLRGVNDDPRVLEVLFRALVRIRVRPYYLFQCDLVQGVEHFRTPLARGIEVMEYLRGRLSGLAIPLFVVDAPHGGGKIPVLPNYIVSVSPTHTVLRNFEGMIVTYPEPSDGDALPPAPTDGPASAQSVWGLATGQASKIEPANSARKERRRVPRVSADRRPRRTDAPFTSQ
jgi:lysine 2,3-aminomutase